MVSIGRTAYTISSCDGGGARTYRGDLAILKGVDDTVELELSVDILLLLLHIDRLIDVCHIDDEMLGNGSVL